MGRVGAAADGSGVELPYPLVALIAFTPYAALTSPLPVILALVLRRWRVALLAGVAGGAVAWRCCRGRSPGRGRTRTGPRLVVMTSNVWLGSADVEALLRVAREHDVDVLSLQELRPKTVARLERAGAAEQFPQPDRRSRSSARAAARCSRACR